MQFERWLNRVRLRIRSLVRRNTVERELGDEMTYHLERQIEANVAKGMTPAEARYAALRAMGGIDQKKEECRDARRLGIVENLAHDLRYASRQLRQSPTFTIVAVLILALGIGANTAIFTLVNTVLLKKLPVSDPDRLYMLQPGAYGFSYSGYELLRDTNDVFSHTFTFSGGRYNVVAHGRPEFTSVELVTGNYFQALGVEFRTGRPITESDSSPVAVISDSYWEETFARDRTALGSSIAINRIPFTIVGVAPPDFFGVAVGSAPDIWVPIAMHPQINPGDNSLADSGTIWLSAMARLKPGVGEEQARANLAVILPALREKMGIKENAKIPLDRIQLLPGAAGASFLRDQYSLALTILMAVVGTVLLIACANLAGLLMSRGSARRREMAIRLAIGAARPRLVRQLLTESVLLSAVGGTIGLAFAVWSTQVLAALVAGGLQISVDVPMLAFAAGLSLFTGILFGIAPALRNTRLNLNPVLKNESGSLTNSRHRFGKALIALQVALSLLLLTGAGLFVRTVHNLKTTGLGFDPDNVLVMTLEPAMAGYKDSALASLYGEILDRVQAIPGVRAASISRFGLIGGGYATGPVSVPGYVPPETANQEASGNILRMLPSMRNQVARNAIGPRFFETAGIPLLYGREFAPADTISAPRVAVVNTKFARTYFGIDNPVGRTFGFQPPPAPQFEIVGVVQDSKFLALRNESPPTVFTPYFQPVGANQGGRAFLAVRTAVAPASVMGAVRNELYSIARELPVHDARTQDEQLDVTLVRERLLATLSGFFSLLALVLACLGLYGLMSYSVIRRTNEIGIRVALGAKRREVIRLVLGEAFWMVAAGVAAGLGASLALTRFVAAMLFGVTPNDPATIAVSIALMISVAMLAGYIPARRASRVDPIAALRHD